VSTQRVFLLFIALIGVGCCAGYAVQNLVNVAIGFGIIAFLALLGAFVPEEFP
jgi:hypothetical protein